MAQTKIVFLDSYTTNPGDLSWSILQKQGELACYENIISYPEIVAKASDAEIIILNKAVIGDRELQELPKLKLICVAATGYNSIDIAACRKHDVHVCNVSGYSSPAVAQHVFALILALRNKVIEYSKEVNEGVWSNQPYFSYQHESWFELKDKTLGIFGLGKIGEEVAKIGHAFGMKIIAYRKHPEKGSPSYVSLVSQKELFANSDILSLHTALNQETEGLINKERLALMKSSAYVINTGRGGLVVEADLKEALEYGQIAGAGLDVLSAEPPSSDHILLNVENCVITPHKAWGSLESRARLVEGLAKNIAAYQKGEMINVVS